MARSIINIPGNKNDQKQNFNQLKKENIFCAIIFIFFHKSDIE